MKNLLIMLLLAVSYSLAAQTPEAVGDNYKFVWVNRMLASDADSCLYVVGMLQTVNGGDTLSVGVAKWDGQQWAGAGISFDSTRLLTPLRTRDIALFKNELYVSGEYNNPTKSYIYPLAKKVGYQWHNVVDTFRPGVNINALYPTDSLLYIGGLPLDTIGGVPISSIAVYDGQQFHSLPPFGAGVIPSVGCIIRYRNRIYAGGNITYPTTAFGTDDLKVLDGNMWESVGDGFSGATTAILSMVEYKGKLVVGGYFFQAQSDPGNFVAAWNDTIWEDMPIMDYPPGGLGTCNYLYVHEGELYMGGHRKQNGWAQSQRGLFRWNGQKWDWLVETDHEILCMTSWRGDLYVGGKFQKINNNTMLPHIFKYHPLVGVSEPFAAGSLRLSPNPATDALRLSLAGDLATGEYELEIRDMQGRTLLCRTDTARETTLDTRSLSSGTYFLLLRRDGKTYSERFVVAR